MARDSAQDLRRRLPSVDRLLTVPRLETLCSLYGRGLVRVQVREQLERLRAELAMVSNAGTEALDRRVEALPETVAEDLSRRLGTPLRRVLNATGVFLHTNLGRAPLPREVAAGLPASLDAYCDLELDLDSGKRGDRNRRAGELVAALCGAEAALVVNNNAAALVLALATVAGGREVIVSRGELVEIGGSFRIPDILAAAGSLLVEVGTTNRTRLADYERAIGDRTALLLKVHPSNYRVSGFVSSVAAADLAALGQQRRLPVLMDEGSGLLRPHPAPQLSGHESLSELLSAGCDLVCGSADKLLGGPQAGLLAGRQELVERCQAHPLYRAFRPDRATFSTLESVLRMHLARQPLPLDRMWPEPGTHRRRLRQVADRIGADIVAADAYLGGGAAPDEPIAGEVLALSGPAELASALRGAAPPVVGYMRDGRLILDLRTVDPLDDEALVEAVGQVAGRLHGG